MLYALFNLAMAYVLLVVVGSLALRHGAPVAVLAAGFGLGSIFIARSVTKLKGSSQPLPTASRSNDGGGGDAVVAIVHDHGRGMQ